jgi:PPK2 family polyphosphate:nucleotide phosphotransferase
MKRKFESDDFRVQEGKKVRLNSWPTSCKPYYDSKEDYEQRLAANVSELSDLQNLLYAHNRYSLLVIFQAMDAAGKDGVIRHVMSGINPQGCQVFSFKHPSAEELDHDFLWRTTRSLPERGRIGIFNRSYYEEVLIVRVHPEILLAEALPEKLMDKKKLWRQRYDSIVEMEQHLHRNGTKVVKFFLHISREEQRQRFLARLDDPQKNWKFCMGDVEERKFWKQYMEAYEDCLHATSTRHAPWYVVPADDKKNTRLIVSRIVVETLRKLKLSYPTTAGEHQRELQAAKKLLMKE